MKLPGITQIAFSILCIAGFSLLAFSLPSDFLADQLKNARVKVAVKEKRIYLENKLKAYKINIDNLNMLIVAYKENDLVDIYAKTKQQANYKKLLSYPICSRSGLPGPKRKQGDGQVPEGFYHIERFNPASSFYLSLGINYPNLSDRRKITNADPGGDIFIHGSCVTIGCLPMTDDFIKEIYLLAIYAKSNGQQKIPVYIFPFQMSDENFSLYKEKYKANKSLIAFWTNLKTGYDKFHEQLRELTVKVNEKGDYIF